MLYEVITIVQNCIEDGGFIPLEDSIKGGTKEIVNDLLLESGKCLLIPYCILLSNMNNDYDPKKCLTYNHLVITSYSIHYTKLYDG